MLRPLSSGDRERLSAWIRDPAVRNWWGDASSAEAEIAMALDTPHALCRIIEVDGTPIGYAHAVEWDMPAAATERLAPGTWSCTAFIADAAHRGQGHGQRALDALVGEVFATTLAIACAVRVPVTREPTARAYEAIGFKWISVTKDPILGASWLMVRDRPSR